MIYLQIGILLGRTTVMVGWDEGFFSFVEKKGEIKGFGLRGCIGKQLFDDELEDD